MLPEVEIDVIILAIEKKNGNENEAAMMLIDDSEVKRLQEEVKEKKEKEKENLAHVLKQPIEKTVDKGISLDLSNKSKYFNVFFDLMKTGNTIL